MPVCGAFEEDRAQHVGAFEELGGRAVEPDLALLHEVRGLRDREREVHRLLDEDDRGSLRGDVAHERQQLLDDRRREPERELVDHQEPRLLDEGHAEREHLLLAAGEVAGGLVEPVAQHGEELEHALGRRRDAFLVLAVQPAREAQVLGDGQRRERALAARHLHDAAARDLVGRRVRHVAPVEHDGAVRRLDQTGDRLQQRRLAGAVGAEQRDDLAFVDLEVHAEQHLHAVVVHVDVADEEQLHLALLALQASLRPGPRSTSRRG